MLRNFMPLLYYIYFPILISCKHVTSSQRELQYFGHIMRRKSNNLEVLMVIEKVEDGLTRYPKNYLKYHFLSTVSFSGN